MERIMSFLVSFLALILTAWLVPGLEIATLSAGILAALVLALVNTLLKPILTFFTLPLTILSFGLFLLVINGLMLLLTASLVAGFYISGFWSAILASLVLSIVSSLMEEAVLVDG